MGLLIVAVAMEQLTCYGNWNRCDGRLRYRERNKEMTAYMPTTDRPSAPTYTNDLDVVPARYEDMSLVANFVRSSAEWYREIVDEKDMAEHFVDEQWAEINFRRRDFYLGKLGDEPVGTISLQYFGDFAYVGYAYLDIQHVGKGYGRDLLRFAESLSLDRGMHGLSLICHPKAVWAQRAYTKFGFKRIASAKQDILSWQDGALEPHYEEGFELYIYSFAS